MPKKKVVNKKKSNVPNWFELLYMKGMIPTDTKRKGRYGNGS